MAQDRPGQEQLPAIFRYLQIAQLLPSCSSLLHCAFVNVAKVKNVSFFIIEHYEKLCAGGQKMTVSQEC